MVRLSFALFIFTGALCITGCKEAPEVLIVPAKRANVESIVSNVNAGTVRAERTAELAFGAVGRVKRLNVDLGDVVKQDQILAEVENADLTNELARAEREYKRRVTLSSREVSQSELDAARQAVDWARMALEKTTIRAPYDGVITEVNLEVGQLSQITAVIPRAPLRIIDLDSRYIRAEIDEVDLPKVKVGMPARVRILAVRKEPFVGKVRKIIPYVSSVREQDRTSEIEISATSDVLLPAGASADVEIIVAEVDNVITSPTRAVLGRNKERYLFKAVESKAIKTKIEAGLWNYDLTEIKQGINEGEEIIIPSDLSELEDGTRISRKISP